MIFALFLGLGAFLVSAESSFAQTTPTFSEPQPFDGSLLDYAWYGRMADYTNVYAEPSLSAPVVRNADDGFLYVSILKREKIDGVNWYKINNNEWIQEADLTLAKISEFQGVEVNRTPERPFGWIVKEIRPSRSPGAEPNPDVDKLERYDFFEVYAIVEDDEGWLWYDTGDDHWIKQTQVSLIDLSTPMPNNVPADAKWVEVDLYEQTLVAYEGNQMVYASLISSGLNKWPTREGLFEVWDRYQQVKMSGAEGKVDYYFIEDVPFTMYFDRSKGIALHGAYWHDGFGYKKSHGCVNMPPRDAEWVWHWSEGDEEPLYVWVHTSDPTDILRAPNVGKPAPTASADASDSGIYLNPDNISGPQ